jgi:membrane protein DedA with SNARE-associated domain
LRHCNNDVRVSRLGCNGDLSARITRLCCGHPNFAFAAVFLLALSEAIPVVGTVVPGSSLILGICALVTTADVKPWPLLVAAFLGAVVGDGVSFWLGYQYRREILRGWPLNRFPRLIAHSAAFIKK